MRAAWILRTDFRCEGRILNLHTCNQTMMCPILTGAIGVKNRFYRRRAVR
jgi:hypothetical protein